MMASNNFEYVYEEILKEFIKKSVISKNLDEAQNKLFSEFLIVLSKYYIEINNHSNAETINHQYHVRISNHIKISNSICHEHNALNEKLKNLQKLQIEVETKKQETIMEFCKNMEDIYNSLKKLPQEFDHDSMKEDIKKCLEHKQFCDETIPKLQKEIENMNEHMNHLESCEILNIDKITKMVQNESVNYLGEPQKIQKRISAIREKNKLLLEKCTI